jgi:hypothetical protein
MGKIHRMATGFAIVLSALPCSAGTGARTVDPADASCIAVAVPALQGVPGNADDAAIAVRDLLMKYLSAPSVKAIALETRLASQAPAEAKQKGCGSVLFAALTRKAGGGGFKKALGQAAGTSSWYLPGGGTVASTAAHAAAATGLQTVATLAASTKAKDEVRLEYRLESPAGAVQFGPKRESRTASIDGEDLVTPIVMRVADVLVTRGDAR